LAREAPLPRHLLILDLDETLVYATEQPRDDLGPGDLRIGEYTVYRRPFLDEFLRFVEGHFDLAVWSSAGGLYVAELVAHLFPPPSPLRFVWSCERCTRRFHPETQDHYWVKDFKKVKRAGFALEHVLMIDDTPEKLERNYGNHLRVRPFEGQADDTELRDLIPFLNRMLLVEDMRSVEKRNWRQFARVSGT
jgi:TFIIF-interacting CTD phosphatase-like protein